VELPQPGNHWYVVSSLAVDPRNGSTLYAVSLDASSRARTCPTWSAVNNGCPTARARHPEIACYSMPRRHRPRDSRHSLPGHLRGWHLQEHRRWGTWTPLIDGLPDVSLRTPSSTPRILRSSMSARPWCLLDRAAKGRPPRRRAGKFVSISMIRRSTLPDETKGKRRIGAAPLEAAHPAAAASGSSASREIV